MSTAHEYDGLDRLTRLRDATAITTIADNQYNYNTANQITQISDLGGAHAYGYDSVDRLTSAGEVKTTGIVLSAGIFLPCGRLQAPGGLAHDTARQLTDNSE